MAYDITDKQARLPLVYGRHSIRGALIKHNVAALSSTTNQVTIQQALGYAPNAWEGIIKVGYGTDSIYEIDAANYAFHAGGGSDALDAFFPSDTLHPKAAYLNVRLPEGVATDDDPDKLLVIADCMRVENYNSSGAVTATDFSANPARVLASISKLTRPRILNCFDWGSWIEWRDWCDETISATVDSSTVSIPRFRADIFILPPFALKTVFDRMMEITCSDFQWVNGKIRFLAPVDRTPVFDFDLDEMT